MFTLSQKQLLFLSIISLVFFFTFFVLINPLITNAYTITEELSIIGDLNISGTEVTLGSETFNQGKYMSFNLNQGGSKIYDDVHLHISTDDYLFLESRERVFVTTDLEVWGSLIADLFQGEFEGNLTGDVEGTVTGSLIGNATGLSGNPSLTVNNLTTLGIVTLPNNSITDAMIPNSITASKYFPVIGGTINGNVKLNDHNITNIRTLSTTNLTVFGTIKFPNNSLTDNMIPNTITASNYLPLSGGTMSGDINLGTNDLTNGGSITATSFSGNLTGNVTGSLSGGSVDITALTMASGASSGYVLTTDGSGVASWTDVSSTGGPWTLSGSNLYPDDTSYNVGIGTTNPTSLFHLERITNGNISSYSSYLHTNVTEGDTVGFPYVTGLQLVNEFTGTDTQHGMTGISSRSINTNDGTVNWMYGLSSGVFNYGNIATVGYGNSSMFSNYGSGYVASAYNYRAQMNNSGGGTIAEAALLRGSIGNSSGTINNAYGVLLNGYSNGGTVDNSYGIYLHSSIDIGTNRYAIYSAATSNSYFAGNVGIGTTNPSTELQIGGTTPFLTLGDNGAEDTGIIFDGEAQNYYLSYYASNGNLVFGTGTTIGSAQKAIIESGGNFGIGIENAVSILHVGSSSPILTLQRTDTGVGIGQMIGELDFYSNDTSLTGSNVAGYARVIAQSDFDAVHPYGRLEFGTASGTAAVSTKMVLDKDGNVGIGTTSPLSQLYVDQGITGGTPGNDRGISVLRAGTPISVGRLFVDANDRFVIGTNSYSSINIVGKNVGIYSSPPSYRLDVNGETTDSVARFYNTDDLAQILISDNDTTGYWGVKDNSAFFGLNSGLSNNNFTITSSGNVGIGTTNPTAKLHILGTTDTQQLIVTANGTQTANILEWQNSSGTPLGYVNNTGRLFLNLGTDITNQFIGSLAGNTTTTGTGLIGIGHKALNVVTNGESNVAIGSYPLSAVTSGDDNIGIGYRPLYTLQTGSNNIALGSSALYQNISGGSNVAIGVGAGYSNLGSGSVFIGTSAGSAETGSDKLYIENSNSVSPLIWGDFANDLVSFNGDVGIGTTSPSGLQVNQNVLTTAQNISNFRGGIVSNNPYLILEETVVGSQFYIYKSGAAQAFARNATGDDIYISAAGYIGIGSNNPGSLLSVDGNVAIGSNYDVLTAPADSLIVQGNVGIGATAPSYPLTVISSVNTLASFTGSSETSKLALTGSRYAGADKTQIDFGWGTTVTSRIESNLMGPAETNMVFYTTQSSAITKRMILDYTGKLGVGNINPSQLFDVNNNFVVTSTGAVGIGTTSPNHKLDVVGNVGVSAGGYLNFGSTDGESGYGIRDNAGTIEYKNSAEEWTALDGGSSYTAGDDLDLNVAEFSLEDDVDVSTLRASSASGLQIFDDGGNLGLFIEDGGYVGLGTSSPSQPLHIVAAGYDPIVFLDAPASVSPSDANSPALAQSIPASNQTDWSNPQNVYSSNNVYTSSTMPTGYTTEYLKITDFGFTIPADATINGVYVEFERYASGSGVTDQSVMLVVDDVYSGNDLQTDLEWGITDPNDYTGYGGSSNLWGVVGLTATQVNNSTFGVAIRARDDGGGNRTAYIDHVRITIYYTPSTGTNWVMGGDITDRSFKISMSSGFGTNDYFMISANGNVGIGTTNPETKLEVNGGIKPISVTADPCGSGYPEGTIFYNDTGNYMCYCDGTNDVQLHSPATACF